MIGRLALLGVMLASLPLAVDLPADSSRAGQLTVTAAGGGGQFAILSRGCNGNVVRVAHNQLLSGALVVEERLPGNFVLGVRAGSVRTTMHPGSPVGLVDPYYTYVDSTFTQRYANPYVNPYVGYEGRRVGIGAGALMADRPFLMSNHGFLDAQYDYQRLHATGHLRLGSEQQHLTLRWMEDVPLESEGHFSADIGVRASPRFEAGAFAGFAGPYDGTMLGIRGRVWVTPEAALQIKASTTGRYQEYGVYGSITAGWHGAR
jgi:hypothetical protein